MTGKLIGSATLEELAAVLRAPQAGQPFSGQRLGGSAWRDLLDVEGDAQLSNTVSCAAQPGASITYEPQSNVPIVNAHLTPLVYCDLTGPMPLTLSLQADAPIGDVIAVLNYRQGAAQYRRILPVSARVRNLRLFASSVDVSVFASTDNGTVTVRGSITPGEVDSLGDVEVTHVPWATATGLANAQLLSGPGCLLSISGGILTGLGAGDAAEYLMFYDLAAGDLAPTGASVPLMTIGPLVLLSPFTAHDDERPSLEFSRGLYFQLSATPVRLTVTGAGAACKFDYDWGT